MPPRIVRGWFKITGRREGGKIFKTLILPAFPPSCSILRPDRGFGARVRLVFTALACALLACGPAAPRARQPTAATAAAPSPAERERRLREWEDAIVSQLAVIDARLALRVRWAPTDAELEKASMDAVVQGDPGTGVLKGALDLFSFDARARKLGALRAVLAQPPLPGDDLEIELVRRLVYAEEARVAYERDLPRSASELVRGLVATWTPAKTPAEAKERDAWVAKRLEDVRASLGDGTLSASEIWELEDALDPLERLCDPMGYPDGTAALTRLRIALGAQRRPATFARGHGEIDKELHVLLGMGPELANVEARLAEAEAAFRPATSVTAASQGAAESLVFAESPCEPVEGSRVRSFAPPPERRAICGALVALAHAKDDEALAAAKVALHDDAVVAGWAYAMQAAGVDPQKAALDHPLLLSRDTRDRLLRFAVTRPIAAIAVGLAASLLVSKTEPPEARAKKWLAFGDAPLDIVQRELGF